MSETATKTQPAPAETPVHIEMDGTTAADVFSALRIVAGFASRDDGRAVLCAVHMNSDGKRLRIEGTDSYRLARLDMSRLDGWPEFDVLVDARWLTKNLPKGKPSISERFEFDVIGGRFKITDRRAGTEASIATTGGGAFPNTSSMFDGDFGDDGAEFERAFNPKLLAATLHAAHQFSGGGTWPVRIRHLDPMKPCRFDVDGPEGTLTMLLMPVRVR